MTSTNVSVPGGTSYACTSKVIPLPDTGGCMIVAVEPLFTNYSTSFVHHFKAYICIGDQYSAITRSTVLCDAFMTGGLFGPTANAFAMCSITIYGCKLRNTFFKFFYHSTMHIALQILDEKSYLTTVLLPSLRFSAKKGPKESMVSFHILERPDYLWEEAISISLWKRILTIPQK